MFAIGDKVVRKRPGTYTVTDPVPSNWPTVPPLGRVLVVDGVISSPCWDGVGLIFNPFPSDHPTKSWASHCFEKIVGADADFCEMIQKLKPKVKEDA
jgi:hypothetical protein